MPGLTRVQRTLCLSSPDLILPLLEGVRMAGRECQKRFKNHRWNCSNIGRINPLAPVIIVGSKEAAITWALWSAGAAWSVTAACARGQISGCSCDSNRPASSWKWTGCSVDLGAGLKVSRKFLDARELQRDPRSLMNLHNNRAGRAALKTSILRECKCHGVSGSCTMKSCWRALPPFSAVSERLMKRYRRAKQVAHRSGKGLIVKGLDRAPQKGELAYLEASPNYCEPNSDVGSLGTHGRHCDRTSKGNDGCEVLCCGRGYNSRQVIRRWQCACKFHWCCYVQCQTCVLQTDQHTCK